MGNGSGTFGLRLGDGSALIQEPAAVDQELGNLDGIGGGALAQVVARDPDVEGAFVARVAANSPDEDIVLAGGVDRQRVLGVGRVVDDLDADRFGKEGAAVLG